MIVEAKEDVIVLSGSLIQNYWDTVKTAAALQLKRHPGGVIIDCGLINKDVTIEGAETFRDAMNYIESRKARIIVANVPPHLYDALRQVPGVRSQLPIADTVEAARQSLDLSETDAPMTDSFSSKDSILVPVEGNSDDAATVRLAARIAQARKTVVHIVYCIDTPRALPIGTPLPEEEKKARIALDEGEKVVRSMTVKPIRHVEHGRDWSETLIRLSNSLGVKTLLITISAEPSRDTMDKVANLLQKAPCELLLYRVSQRLN